MDRRVMVMFCLLTAVRSNDAEKPDITFDKDKRHLNCTGGEFNKGSSVPLSYATSGLHTCKSDGCTDDESKCATRNAVIKVLSSEHLIQLDKVALASVILSDILATALIGWAVYSVCAQPKTRGGYQGNKASDRVNLIDNHNRSGGDTYQRLNTRADEYSTLQARKNKTK